MNRTTLHASRPSRGFTLVEMMVVIAILVILGTIATASMRGMIDRSRMETATSDFVGDLQFARSEAITRGMTVSLCPSANGTSCLGSDAWQGGWIVFVDRDGSGAVAPGAPVLRRRTTWAQGYNFVATPGMGALSFGRDGFVLALPAAGAQLRAEAASGDRASVRCVSLNRAGHYLVQAAGTGACA